MRIHQRSKVFVQIVCVFVLAGAMLAGCQTQRGDGASELPSRIVVWEDPETGDQGTPIRDANNDENRIAVVGTNGRVQFVQDGTVCNDCRVTEATIELEDGHLIDIRVGVGAVGDNVRRPFLVDRNTGNFVQLVGGGGSPVSFQVTSTPFEEPNDSTDDMAVPVGETDNPTLEDSGGGQASLCGAAGGMIPLVLLGLLLVRLARRR